MRYSDEEDQMTMYFREDLDKVAKKAAWIGFAYGIMTMLAVLGITYVYAYYSGVIVFLD